MTPTDMIDTIHSSGAAEQAGDLAGQIMQLGRDEMAAALAELLDSAAEETDAYRDGVEDAIRTLVNAGANDPR